VNTEIRNQEKNGGGISTRQSLAHAVALDNEREITSTPFGGIRKGHIKIAVFLIGVVLAVIWCIGQYNKAMETNPGRETFNTTWLHAVLTALPIFLLSAIFRQVRKQDDKWNTWYQQLAEGVQMKGSPRSRWARTQYWLLTPLLTWCLVGTWLTSRHFELNLDTDLRKQGLYAALYIMGFGVLGVIILIRWLMGMRGGD